MILSQERIESCAITPSWTNEKQRNAAICKYILTEIFINSRSIQERQLLIRHRRRETNWALDTCNLINSHQETSFRGKDTREKFLALSVQQIWHEAGKMEKQKHLLTLNSWKNKSKCSWMGLLNNCPSRIKLSMMDAIENTFVSQLQSTISPTKSTIRPLFMSNWTSVKSTEGRPKIT